MDKNENSFVGQKDIILLKDIDYFGRKIRKGSTFKRCVTNSDFYQLYENNGRIIMHCPSIELHFTIIIDGIKTGYFIEQYCS